MVKRSQIHDRTRIGISIITLWQLSTLSLAAHSSPLAQLPATHQTEQSNQSILAQLMQLFEARRPRREGIRRGDNFCPISPAALETVVIWNDRPLFLWQGATTGIVVKNFDTGELIWQQTVDTAARQVSYSGEPLQPGQIYQWEAKGIRSNQVTSTVFKIQDHDRAQIAQQLQQIEMQYRTLTPDAIALMQAQFFGDQNLWSDALQTLYSIETPSAEVLEARQTIAEYICTSSSESTSELEQ